MSVTRHAIVGIQNRGCIGYCLVILELISVANIASYTTYVYTNPKKKFIQTLVERFISEH